MLPLPTSALPPALPPCSLEVERAKALTEMNGHFLSNRPIRVSLATAKKNANTTTASAVQAPHPSGAHLVGQHGQLHATPWLHVPYPSPHGACCWPSHC